MTLTIQDLGALGELLGSVAVLVTLIYLAMQTRQNSLVLRSSTHSSNSLFVADLNAQIGREGELAHILRTSAQAQSFGDDLLNPEEWFRFAAWMRGVFFGCEDLFQQYELGAIDPAVWKHRGKWLKSLATSSPALKEWWETECAAGAFNPRYAKAIDSIELNIPGEYLYDPPQASA